MSAVEALPAYLPYLRRFARALTGSQALGDGYALAALEAAAADPVGTYDGPDHGVRLYRLLLKIWTSAANARRRRRRIRRPIPAWKPPTASLRR